MKIRFGFVSNSSSSSFVIKKQYLSQMQIEGIKNHATCGIKYSDTDPWKIIETKNEIKGSTYMDNFNIYSYMYVKLGIKKEHIEIDEWERNDFWNEYENKKSIENKEIKQ